MSRPARTALILFAIVIAMVVGLLRPPFGADHHAAAGPGAHVEVVQHGDDHVRAAAHAGHDHDGDAADPHDAADHSHVPASLPSPVTVPAMPSEWSRPADLAAASTRWAAISFDRPPRTTVFA